MSKVTLEPSEEIWGILHLPTNKFIRIKTKCGWTGRGPAIRAWQVSQEYEKFGDYSDFVAVNLTEAFYRLQQMGEQQ